MAYFGYVQSILSYGIIFWGNSVNSVYAFRAQKRCVRALCGWSQRDSCKPLFMKFGILPLPCLYIKEVATFVRKHINLYKTGEGRERKLRYDHKLRSKLNPKTSFYQKSIYDMSIKIYNRIPDEFKKLPLKTFKSKIFGWLQTKLYYSVEEFLNDELHLLIK